MLDAFLHVWNCEPALDPRSETAYLIRAARSVGERGLARVLRYFWRQRHRLAVSPGDSPEVLVLREYPDVLLLWLERPRCVWFSSVPLPPASDCATGEGAVECRTRCEGAGS